MYMHFASGFVHDGALDTRFEALMSRLAGKNCWFVPVATLLDHLAARHDDGDRRRSDAPLSVAGCVAKYLDRVGHT